MGDNKKYTLKSGTVLDNRYVIEEVLGEGGFGITYRGIHKSIGMTVAVKEFFSKDIMTRNADETEEVSLIWDENKDRFEREKNKFLKEARIISDFSKEDGVVHIMDYFEANNTVYIVMEYIEGESLRDYVNKHGAFSVDDVISKMMPVITTLGKINDCGVIHRDIGPNNIMVEKDGSFRLIDFGSARDYETMDEKSYSVVLTGGYAPPEQYDKNGHLGPWTDVYAVCAVIYFCITGYSPQEGVSRLLYDELEKPSDRGVKIKSEIERIIIRGLSVNPKDRYQSMEELAKDLTPQVKVKKEQNSNKKALIVGISVAALAILISAGIFFGNKYYQAHKEEIMFDDGKVQHFILKPTKSTTVKQFNDAKEVIERRLKVLTDDKYILEQEDDKLRIAISSDIIGKNDLYNGIMTTEDFVKDYIVGSNRIDVYNWYKEKDRIYNKKVGFFDYKDIDSIKVKKGVLDTVSLGSSTSETEKRKQVGKYLEIKIKKESKNKLDKFTKVINVNRSDDKYGGGQLKEGVVDPKHSLIKIQIATKNKKLTSVMIQNLINRSSKKSLALDTYDKYIKWENVNKASEKGSNQVNEDKLKGITETFIYDYSDVLHKEMTKGQYYSALLGIKDRMDGLGVNYSIGKDAYKEKTIAVKLKKKDINTYIMKNSLIKQTSSGCKIKCKNTTFDISTINYKMNVTKNKAVERMILKDNTYDKDIKKVTKKMIKNGDRKIYLKMGPYRVSTQIIQKPITNGTFVFEQKNLNNKKLDYFNFMKKLIFDTSIDVSLDCSLSFWNDGDKLISVKKDNLNDLPGIEKRYNSDKKKIKKLFENYYCEPLYEYIQFYNSNILRIHCRYMEKSDVGIKKMVSTWHNMVKKLKLLDGTYDEIYFYTEDDKEGSSYNYLSIKDNPQGGFEKDAQVNTYKKTINEKSFINEIREQFNDIKWGDYSYYKKKNNN